MLQPTGIQNAPWKANIERRHNTDMKSHAMYFSKTAIKLKVIVAYFKIILHQESSIVFNIGLKSGALSILKHFCKSSDLLWK